MQKLSIFEGGNGLFWKYSRKNSTTQGKNSKLKTKTQGFGKVKNAVCRKRVQKKKPVLKVTRELLVQMTQVGLMNI